MLRILTCEYFFDLHFLAELTPYEGTLFLILEHSYIYEHHCSQKQYELTLVLLLGMKYHLTTTL